MLREFIKSRKSISVFLAIAMVGTVTACGEGVTVSAGAISDQSDSIALVQQSNSVKPRPKTAAQENSAKAVLKTPQSKPKVIPNPHGPQSSTNKAKNDSNSVMTVGIKPTINDDKKDNKNHADATANSAVKAEVEVSSVVGNDDDAESVPGTTSTAPIVEDVGEKNNDLSGQNIKEENVNNEPAETVKDKKSETPVTVIANAPPSKTLAVNTVKTMIFNPTDECIAGVKPKCDTGAKLQHVVDTHAESTLVVPHGRYIIGHVSGIMRKLLDIKVGDNVIINGYSMNGNYVVTRLGKTKKHTSTNNFYGEALMTCYPDGVDDDYMFTAWVKKV